MHLLVVFWLGTLFNGVPTFLKAYEPFLAIKQMQSDEQPYYLYKIISLENWKKSQSQASVFLSKEDQNFIHLSKEEQLNKIIEKYWSDEPEYVVLKIETDRLPGRLIYEANPGGTNKYYHLYDGSIPLEAVVEAKIFKSKR